MAFNLRFPDAVPVLDTAGLVALISDPQKATEYWAKYEQARKDYDAYVASAKASKAEADTAYKAAADLLQASEAARAAFNKEVADFDAAKAAWVKSRNVVEQAYADRELDVKQREALLADKQAKLDEARKIWDAQLAKDDLAHKEIEAKLEAWADELAAREAAVAEREAKAEKLAELLKSV